MFVNQPAIWMNMTHYIDLNVTHMDQKQYRFVENLLNIVQIFIE